MAESGNRFTFQAATEPSIGASAKRGVLSLIASRFAFTYLIFYCYFGLGIVPFVGEWVGKPVDFAWRHICPWVAVHVFRLSGSVTQYHPTGSGDTTLDYIQVFCYALLSAMIAVVWSSLDRSQRRDQILYPWVRLMVRFYLASVLLSYGWSKIYPTQFPAPDFTRLTETFGEASPMGLLWAFMGASPYYQSFGGWAEAVPGLLLLFRRTSTAGALFAVAVMGNVVVLNFCYDVPVKLFSSHLLLMALFFLIPDIAPLWRFLVLRKASKLEGIWIPRFERRYLRITAVALQILVIGNALYGSLDAYRFYKKRTAATDQGGFLSGIWDLDNLATSVADQPAPASSDNDWRRLMVPDVVAFGRVGVRVANGKLLRFSSNQDKRNRKLQLKGWRNEQSAELFYQQPDHEHLVLTGTIDRKSVNLHFHRFHADQSLLTTRGFHWISEDPYLL